MGEVWRARDKRLHRDVAVKVLLGTAHGDDALPRFEREARAVAALSHPNILAIHDFGTESGTLYAVMEQWPDVGPHPHVRLHPVAQSSALDRARATVGPHGAVVLGSEEQEGWRLAGWPGARLAAGLTATVRSLAGSGARHPGGQPARRRRSGL